MSSQDQPLVSIITPVYNGGPYFAECIESVLSQTYSNWEYTIVNNCSTDGTFELAQSYAQRDRRIRVLTNETFLDIIGNANKAFSQISQDSKYCKSISADDWIYPDCLTAMVGLAESNPSVGLVNSYQLSGSGANGRNWRVKWAEIPYGATITSGHDACRAYLLGGPYLFGTPTSLLYRSDLVRQYKPFYPNLTAEADTSACIQCLQTTDFGFVHQVLSYERIHEQTISAECRTLNTYVSSRLGDLVHYGSVYLTPAEFNQRLEEVLDEYYGFLGVSVFHNRDKAFWDYHKRRLAELGHPLSEVRLASAGLGKFMDLLLNPKQTVEKMLRK